MIIKPLFSNKDLLAFYKEGGLPTVPLKTSNNETLLSLISREYPEVLECGGPNYWEGGIIHRLDTPTSGIVLATRNQEAYDYLIKLQKEDKIVKKYRALVSKQDNMLSSFPPFPYAFNSGKMVITSYFRGYGKKGASVRPLLNIDTREYKTIVEKESEDSFICTITRGFRHQIRCHLSWSGYPIIGDSQYGGKENEKLMLEAISISFPYKNSTLTINI